MRKIQLGLSVLVLGAVLWLARAPILTGLAQYLVQAETPKKADVIIVLGGDTVGSRILTACQLAEQNYSQRIWVSGIQGIYGFWESDLAKQYATGRGCRAEWLTPLHNNVDSTTDEAHIIAPALRAQGVKSYLLVTSNFHTRRAGDLFRKATPEMEVTVVASSNSGFSVDGWWHDRRSRKTFAYEWIKTITSWMGM
ncbi:YdcF family protein [Bryobacter aggregatus]|uniref:YdcF family protein n=1 Tax=Bryobacter aggregatus TaxID=360054 RepID=UPI00138E04D1|nr:YdcF family protein [Bryobacter aggregatus]